MSLLKLRLLVDLEQKVRVLVLSIPFCPMIIVLYALTFKGPMTTLVVTENNRQWPNDD
jgi:hypothetical protein